VVDGPKWIPCQYRGCSLSDAGPECERTIRGWIDAGEYAGFLTFTGPPGTGKTRMAYALRKALREYPDFSAGKCTWARFGFLVKKLQGLAGRDAMDEYAYLKELARDVPFLVLDDLGTEKLTDFTLADVDLLLAEREQWQRRTLVTTNLTLEQIADAYGDRVASRLASGLVVQFAGNDRRIEKRALDELKGET